MNPFELWLYGSLTLMIAPVFFLGGKRTGVFAMAMFNVGIVAFVAWAALVCVILVAAKVS